MKFTLIFITTVVALLSNLFAQDVLIPYKKGNKFGLCNKEGKQIVQPNYDEVVWYKDEFFKTTTKTALNDTLEVSPHHYDIRRNDTVKMTGLIYKGKEILASQPYDDYIVYKNYILASCERRNRSFTKEQYKTFNQQAKFMSLITPNGVNVYPQNFRKIYSANTLTYQLNKKLVKVLLFNYWDFDGKAGMFVYNAEKQMITNWVLKNAERIIVQYIDEDKRLIKVDCTDSTSKKSELIIDYNNGKFKVLEAAALPKKKEVEIREIDDVKISGMDIRAEDALPAPASEISESRDLVFNKPPFKPFYQTNKDSLFYYAEEGKKEYINIQKDKFFFGASNSVVQYELPVIYKNENKYGLIVNGVLKPCVYDSIFYLGRNFLAYIKEGNTTKCGVINTDGSSITIPFVYDSIFGLAKEYRTQFLYRGIALELKEQRLEQGYEMSKKNYPYRKKTSDKLTVFKDGKCGLLSANNDTLIPVQYDLIALNGLEYTLPRNSSYYITKRNDKYGLVAIAWDNKTRKLQATKTVSPVFNELPAYFIKDYYKATGFNLYALYNKEFNLAGYANESGFVYAEP